MREKIPLADKLLEYHLNTLLGKEYQTLSRCILEQTNKDGSLAFVIDEHTTYLSNLHSLLYNSPPKDDNLKNTLEEVARNCQLPYMLKASDIPDIASEKIRLIDNCIEELRKSSWLMLYWAIHYLKQLKRFYLEAKEKPLYSERVSVAILGLGYYHTDKETARRLLCIDEEGRSIKKNKAGAHPVYDAGKIHYKPDPIKQEGWALAPINPGREYIASTLSCFLTDTDTKLIATPSSLISIRGVPISITENGIKSILLTGGLVQASLTIEGVCFREYLLLRSTLNIWEKRLEEEKFNALLIAAQENFNTCKEACRKEFPSVFDEREKEALSEALRIAIETICDKQPEEKKFVDLQEGKKRILEARKKIFSTFLCQNKNEDKVEDVCILLSIIIQFPELMQEESIEGLYIRVKNMKLLFKLFPKASPIDACKQTQELLSTKLDSEASSALWIYLILCLPRDAKADNFILKLHYNDVSEVEYCYLVAIDNDCSLKMPISKIEDRFCLEIKNILFGMPEFLNKSLNENIKKRLCSILSDHQWLSWLSVLALQDSHYKIWETSGIITPDEFKRIDIPVKLSTQVIYFLKNQWRKLQKLLMLDSNVTHQDCLEELLSPVWAAYQSLQKQYSDPLKLEEVLYLYFRHGSRCFLDVLIGESVFYQEQKSGTCFFEMAKSHCESEIDIDTEKSIAMRFCEIELEEQDWSEVARLKPKEMLDQIQAFSLLPLTRAEQWRGKEETEIRPFIQDWLEKAITHGYLLVANKMLNLGANLSFFNSKTQETPLQIFFRYYLKYPNSTVVQLMAELLFTHPSCRLDDYNQSYTPFLHWIHETGKFSKFQAEERKKATVLLNTFPRMNLEAKDSMKHETAVDKLLKDQEMDLLFILINFGAGVHADGKKLYCYYKERSKKIRSHIETLHNRHVTLAFMKKLGDFLKIERDDAENITIKTTLFGVRYFEEKNGQFYIEKSVENLSVKVASKIFCNLFFGELMSPQEVCAVIDDDGKTTPALVYSDYGKTFLNTQDSDSIFSPSLSVAQELEHLDSRYLCEQIIIAMLIQPKNGRANNYRFIPIDSRKPSTLYRLLWLGEGGILHQEQEEIAIRSILFCFKEMLKPVHSAIRARLLSLSPENFIKAWLIKIEEYQAECQVLFEQKEFKFLFLREGDVEKLLERFVQLITELEKNPSITLLKLLWKMYPALEDTYTIALLNEKDISARFKIVSQSGSQIGKHRSVDNSPAFPRRETSSARREKEVSFIEHSPTFSRRKTSSIKREQEVGFIDVAEALKVFKRIVENRERMQCSMEFLKKGINAESLLAKLSKKEKERLFNEIEFATLPGQVEDKIELQKKIIEVFIKEKIPFETLNIRHCEALTGDDLQALLEQAHALKNLCIIDCPGIGDGLIALLQRKDYSVLRVLTLSSLPQLKEIKQSHKDISSIKPSRSYREIPLSKYRVGSEILPQFFVELEECNFLNNLRLERIHLKLPKLKKLSVKSNPMLASIHLESSLLTQVEISQCNNLRLSSLEGILKSCSCLQRIIVEQCAEIKSPFLNYLQEYQSGFFEKNKKEERMRKIEEFDEQFNAWMKKEKVEISDSSFSDPNLVQLTISILLNKHNHLKYLKLSVEFISDSVLDALLKKLRRPLLLEINITQAKLNLDQWMKLKKGIQGNTNMSGVSINVQDERKLLFPDFASFLQSHGKIEDLIINKFNFARVGRQFLEELSFYGEPEVVWNLRFRNLSDMDMHVIACILTDNTHIRLLDLSGNTLSKKGILFLSLALEHNKTIESIFLRACELDDEAILPLKNFIEKSGRSYFLNLDLNLLSQEIQEGMHNKPIWRQKEMKVFLKMQKYVEKLEAQKPVFLRESSPSSFLSWKAVALALYERGDQGYISWFRPSSVCNSDLSKWKRRELEHELGKVLRIVPLARENLFISLSKDKSIIIRDINTGEPSSILTGHNAIITALIQLPQQNLIASGSADRTIKLWNLDDGICFSTLTGHSSAITALIYSSEKNLLISASKDGMIRTWAFGAQSCFDLGMGTAISSMILLFESKFAIGYDDGRFEIRMLENPNFLLPLEGHTEEICALIFFDSQKMLVSASRDNTLRIWDIIDAKCLHRLERQNSVLSLCIFSPTEFVSGEIDGMVYIWNLHNLAQPTLVTNNFCPVHSIIKSRTTGELIIASKEQGITIFDVTPPEGTSCDISFARDLGKEILLKQKKCFVQVEFKKDFIKDRQQKLEILYEFVHALLYNCFARHSRLENMKKEILLSEDALSIHCPDEVRAQQIFTCLFGLFEKQSILQLFLEYTTFSPRVEPCVPPLLPLSASRSGSFWGSPRQYSSERAEKEDILKRETGTNVSGKGIESNFSRKGSSFIANQAISPNRPPLLSKLSEGSQTFVKKHKEFF